MEQAEALEEERRKQKATQQRSGSLLAVASHDQLVDWGSACWLIRPRIPGAHAVYLGGDALPRESGDLAVQSFLAECFDSCFHFAMN